MNTKIHQLKTNSEFKLDDRRDLAKKIFDDLRAMSVDGPGVSRESYGPGETAAMAYCADLAQKEGLIVTYDQAANLVIELPGKDNDAPCIICGSHLDSVPQGGNFDGSAGVVGGLISLIKMKNSANSDDCSSTTSCFLLNIKGSDFNASLKSASSFSSDLSIG